NTKKLRSLRVHDRFCSRAAAEITALAIPANGALKRGLNRTRPVAQLPFGLVASNKHPMARHLHALDGNPRFASHDTREELVCVPSRQSNRVRQPDPRRGAPADDRERIQNLLQRHIARPENVALTDATLFGGKQVSGRAVLNGYQV